MKQTGKITLCAMFAALSVVLMLAAYFPYLTYGVPAVASIFVMLAVIEAGKGYASLTYLASAVITLLLAEPEAKMLYVCFLGFYPILKAVFEQIKSRVLEYVLKFSVFNGAIVLIYNFFASVFGITDDFIVIFGVFGIVLLLLGANFVFLMYDVCLSKFAQIYIFRFHPIVMKFIKK
jgi:hypothetical protein